MDVLRSEVVARRSVGPSPPREWAPSLRQLIEASRSPDPGPSWWTPSNAFFGSVETRLDPNSYLWDGMRRLRKKDAPLFFFQFTLAGWGVFEQHGGAPQRIAPGTGFFAIIPSRHRYYLSAASPGWTFGWIGIYHPYLLQRVTKQVAATGAVLSVEPRSAFIGSALRLVSGAIRKDFRDRFEVELALFEFVIAYERLAYQSSDPDGERDRLLEAVRKRVLADPKHPINVDALAADHGMSRSHFSHFFRTRTGLTPARFVTETRVREAARMLVQSRAPLKQIADACGFANVNHFCRVFRRFRHLSPGAYRRTVG
jgi:AraC-like DNA-binding protein